MTRKDFQAFADLIQAERACPPSIYPRGSAELAAHEITLLRIVNRAARMFKADNARFDVLRFAKACGVDPDILNV